MIPKLSTPSEFYVIGHISNPKINVGHLNTRCPTNRKLPKKLTLSAQIKTSTTRHHFFWGIQ
jgi:hypothetical protein